MGQFAVAALSERRSSLRIQDRRSETAATKLKLTHYRGIDPMTTRITHIASPEARELEKKKAELASLEARLAERELDLAALQAELHSFEGTYLRIVGSRLAELDEIEAQIAEAGARNKPKDGEAQERASQARAQAQESAQAVEAEQEAGKREPFLPSENLKKLYREVAKRIHPDLATDESERKRRHELMTEARSQDQIPAHLRGLARLGSKGQCSINGGSSLDENEGVIRCHGRTSIYEQALRRTAPTTPVSVPRSALS